MKKNYVNGCAHKWEKHPETGNYVCVYCKAIGCTDSTKDPLNHGELIILRPGEDEWAALTFKGRRGWHEKNKQRIITDVKALGVGGTARKWRIPGGTLYGLLARWDMRRGKARVKLPVAPTDGLPALPQFSDSWAPEVQLKWLDVYQTIHDRR